jgi:hypothetical protein
MSDLGIQAAAGLATMKVAQTHQSIGMKVMKMQLQQDQQLVAMLMQQAQQIKDGGYNGAGGAVAAVGSGSVDVAM